MFEQAMEERERYRFRRASGAVRQSGSGASGSAAFMWIVDKQPVSGGSWRENPSPVSGFGQERSQLTASGFLQEKWAAGSQRQDGFPLDAGDYLRVAHPADLYQEEAGRHIRNSCLKAGRSSPLSRYSESFT